MTIIHAEFGEISGVKQWGNRSVWDKNGAYYYGSNGWRIKVEEVWVEEGIIPTITNNRILIDKYWSNSTHRLRVVDRYDLPENWYDEFCDKIPPCHIRKYVQLFLKPCLIIERKKRI